MKRVLSPAAMESYLKAPLAVQQAKKYDEANDRWQARINQD